MAKTPKAPKASTRVDGTEGGGGGKPKSTKKKAASAAPADPAVEAAKAAALAADPSLKTARITAAVSAQMMAEGHWPPPDLVKTFSGDWNYTRDMMRNFLVNVLGRLRAGNPSFSFAIDVAFIVKVLPGNVTGLIAKLDARTS
ncbi:MULTISPECIES: hypothetical protein [unclassified Phenylobacterium]|uniref:hypothetical protein n=1 Tax=unclassified Phenylobacterium TaxID=2640670 RepID=UPI000839FBEB|nr:MULTISPECIES: hypothetical protein [unclassified Phenylobacterium]